MNPRVCCNPTPNPQLYTNPDESKLGIPNPTLIRSLLIPVYQSGQVLNISFKTIHNDNEEGRLVIWGRKSA